MKKIRKRERKLLAGLVDQKVKVLVNEKYVQRVLREDKRGFYIQYNKQNVRVYLCENGTTLTNTKRYESNSKKINNRELKNEVSTLLSIVEKKSSTCDWYIPFKRNVTQFIRDSPFDEATSNQREPPVEIPP